MLTYIHSLCCLLTYLWYTYFQSNFSILWMKKLVHIKWVLFFFFRGWKKTAVSQNSTIWKKQQLFWFPKSFLEKWIDKDWLSSIFCQITFMFDLSLGKFKFQISKSDITYNFRNHIHWAIFILSRPLCAHIY